MDRKRPGVRPRGNSIQIDFYYRGVRCREILRIAPTPSNIRHAEQKREAVLYAIETGKFDYQQFFPKSRMASRLFRSGAKVTVGELLEAFLHACERTTERSTWRDYKSAINHHLLPAFGATLAVDLKPSDVRSWIGTLAISNKRINNILIPLRGAMQDAVTDGLLVANPVSAIGNLKHIQKEPDPFTPDEVHAILTACEGGVSNLFQFAFATGLRTSELIALQWFDIEVRKGVAIIRRASVRKHLKAPKTGAGAREVKLLSPALEALERQKTLTFSRGGQVFVNPRTDKPWETDGQIRKTAWAPALKRAGVRYRYPYQARHTYASTMLSAGENPLWVAQQMGHRDWGMIRKTYGRWMPTVDPTAGAKGALAWSQPGHDEKASA